MPVKPVLLISGPTASGKSSLALKLAKDLEGEVLNVDSVQVYKQFDIGSAKICFHEMDNVPHHLLDLKEPDASYNVAEFIAEAATVAEDVAQRGKQTIIAGGTGLYVTALFHGLADLPQGDLEIRSALETQSSAELFSRLEGCDPETAKRLHENDRLRVIRALETFILAGESSSQIHERHAYSGANFSGLMLILCWERTKLYERIKHRTATMFEDGLIEETRTLLDRYGDNIQGLRTLGYAQAVAFLKGELGEGELKDQVSQQTRRFAKRQMTFWRNEPNKRGWLTRPTDAEQALYIGDESATGAKKLKGFRVFSCAYSELLDKVRTRLAGEFTCNEVWYLQASAL
ncbi:tRNA (adenosine(37)-N6)-dimethylallyltransferase MiaA [Oligoflexia bacterium]|nr:tRNA (adenosine(37)-N6)-dimethylallyltransferase MiaA [Oligoflexia bacterium]